MKRRDERLGGGPEGGLTHNPFASLRRPDASDGVGAAPDASTGDVESAGEPGTDPAPRIVVRRERKGRAGKTVTRVAGLGLAGEELEVRVRDLKRALGCGASIEDGDVVLQGALTERTAAWLRGQGYADVTIGN